MSWLLENVIEQFLKRSALFLLCHIMYYQYLGRMCMLCYV